MKNTGVLDHPLLSGEVDSTHFLEFVPGMENCGSLTALLEPCSIYECTDGKKFVCGSLREVNLAFPAMTLGTVKAVGRVDSYVTMKLLNLVFSPEGEEDCGLP